MTTCIEVAHENFAFFYENSHEYLLCIEMSNFYIYLLMRIFIEVTSIFRSYS